MGERKADAGCSSVQWATGIADRPLGAGLDSWRVNPIISRAELPWCNNVVEIKNVKDQRKLLKHFLDVSDMYLLLRFDC